MKFLNLTGTENLIRIGREGKLTGTVVDTQNIEVEIAEEKTIIAALVSIGHIAERHTGRVVGEIFLPVGEIFARGNTRELHRIAELHRVFQFDHNNVIVVRARIEFRMLKKNQNYRKKMINFVIKAIDLPK